MAYHFDCRDTILLERSLQMRRQDLDLRKPGVWKPAKMPELQVITEEVLRKADFRTVVSAKAKRKVARQIKTARAFGLMPGDKIMVKTVCEPA